MPTSLFVRFLSACPSLTSGLPRIPSPISRWTAQTGLILLTALLGFTSPHAHAAPVFEVLGNGQVIESGSTTPSTANHTDFEKVYFVGSGGRDLETDTLPSSDLVDQLDVVVPTVYRKQTYTIRNTGSEPLHLTDNRRVRLRPYGSNFMMLGAPASPIEPGQSTTFEIGYVPHAVGLHTATVSVHTRDDEENPYTFAIQGLSEVPTTTLAALTRNGLEVNNGSSMTWTLNFTGNITGFSAANLDLSTTGTVVGAQITGIQTIRATDGAETLFLITAKTTRGEGTVSLSLANDTGLSHTVSNTKPAVAFTVDRTAPTFSAPPAAVRLSAGPDGSAVLGDLTNIVTVTDPHLATVTQTPRSGSRLGIGKHPLTLFATDRAGNVAKTETQIVVSFDPVQGAPAVTPAIATGSPAPGAGTGGLAADATITAFFSPALANSRTMAARVTITSGKKKLAGIYRVNGAGEATLPAFQDQPVPGSFEGFTFKSFLDPVLSPGGALAFAATMSWAKPTEDEGVWTDAFGRLERVLREGGAIPGLPFDIALKSVISLSLRDGSLVALVKLAGTKPTVTAGKDDVALIELTGAVTGRLLLRTGMSYTVSPIKSIATLAPASGSPGHGRWHGEGAVLAKVTLANKTEEIVSVSPEGIITLLLSTAAPAEAIDFTAAWKSFGVPAMSSSGLELAVAGTLAPKPGAITSKNDVALFFSPAGGEWEAFAREGDLTPLSSASDGPRYATFFDPVTNEAGQVAYLATLTGKTVTPKNKTALFAGPADDLAVAARLGDFAPDAEGQPTTAVWSKFTSYALPDTSGAGVILVAETSGGDTTARNKLGLWAVDKSGLLRRVLRTGTSFTQNGPLITGFTLLTASPGSYGTARSYSQNGSIAVLATFADRSQQLLRIDLP